MTQTRPLIGLTPGYEYDKSMIYTKDGYYEAVLRTGGTPVTLALTSEHEVLDQYVECVDGFLITGGPDVDARFFGEPNRPYNGFISPLRDAMEVRLIQKAITAGKPVFGICRGVQMMNVAMGGSLYQDIPAQIKSREILKHSQEAPVWYPTHDITIEKDTVIWKVYGGEQADVNSFHHQAVKVPADCFRITSISEDGIIESLEYKDAGQFAVGVQWHPELMWQKNEVHLELFRQFVHACRK